MGEFRQFLDFVSDFLLVFFFIVLAMLVLAVAAMYLIDVTQKTHAIRRNYPVMGRFRYLFEKLGEYFRQYLFAMDREEMPFNRAQRNWVYRSAKNIDSTVPFGSTRSLTPRGTIIFVNTAFPTLDRDAVPTKPMVLGPGCREPFETSSFFHISGMSFGALSKPAVRALSKGAALAGCWLNTGEGSLSPYHLESEGADLIVQIGTAKYGVRDRDGNLDDDKLRELAALPQVKMFEIKISQGAKPGKGGVLPAAKIDREIARIRNIPENEDSISPNRHVEIENVDDLLDMVVRIREVTGKPTGFKMVLGEEEFMDDFCKAVHRRGLDSAPDFIAVDSADGGTGAAPQSLIDYVGMPLRESLPIVVDKLIQYSMKSRIRVVASGKLIEPGAVAWALCVGADFVASGRGFLFALGCIQALQCNKNTCPTGITTHNPKRQKGLVVEEKAVRVMHYCRNMHHEVGVIAHSCGVAEPRQLRRRHARIVFDSGLSIPLDELHPHPGSEKHGSIMTVQSEARSQDE